MLLSMQTAFYRLSVSPYSHSKVRDERLSMQGYRWLGVKNYVVFYTINEQEKSVAVERILYGRRNWAQIL